MTCIDGVNEVVLNLYRNLHLRRLYLLGIELNAALYALIFIGEVFLPRFHQFLQGSNVFFRQRQYDLRLERYGVAHVSSVP